MYEAFFGLQTDPFRLTVDDRFCFSHPSYIRAKASVHHALFRAEGLVMITGRPGTGKTTLVGDLMASLPKSKYVVANLVSSRLEAGELLPMTSYAFGLNGKTPQRAHLLLQLMTFLADRRRVGQRPLLIIDEAQGLAPSAMGELRLLSDLQQENHPLLQIALLGQEELRAMIRRPEMEPIQQRLVAGWHLEPLTPEEMIGYVRHRLEQAGWSGDPVIQPGVLPIVYRFSHGIPRRINLICSRLMLYAYLRESRFITADDADVVVQDLQEGELSQDADHFMDSASRATNQDTGSRTGAQ